MNAGIALSRPRGRRSRRLEIGATVALVLLIAALGYAAWDRHRATQELILSLVPESGIPRPRNPELGSAERLRRTQAFLGRGADVNGFNPAFGSPLSLAVATSDRSLVDLLLSRGARPDPESVDTAVSLEDPRLLARLIQAGADVNETTSQGKHPLITAMWFCRVRNVRLLLAHGARVDTRDGNGVTVLALARQFFVKQHRLRNTGSPPVQAERKRLLRDLSTIMRLLKAAGARE